MSSANSSPASSARATRKKVKKTAPRALSASQIARDGRHYETWSSYHNMSQVIYPNIPPSFRKSVDTVFDVRHKIPKSWLQNSNERTDISKLCSSGFFQFLEDAHNECPSLFTDDVDLPEPLDVLYDQVATVFKAWKTLKSMKESQEKHSEADFAKACDSFRGPAVEHSRQRAQCSLNLPQPLDKSNLKTEAIRVLSAKTVIPDNVLLIPDQSIHDLNSPEDSAFHILKAHKNMKKIGSPEERSSFAFQATPCWNAPVPAAFQFASSTWEDKKATHSNQDDAYRQNKMSTTTIVRQLHGLGIQAPVFGLVWANGVVRAHVDWWKVVDNEINIESAPYPGEGATKIHEWILSNPAHILQVNFLIRNLDWWTCNGFKDIIVAGVNDLKDAVVGGDMTKYSQWRRVGVLKPSKRHAEILKNISISNTSSNNSPPCKKPSKHLRPRK